MKTYQVAIALGVFTCLTLKAFAEPPALGITQAFGVNIHRVELKPGDHQLIKETGFGWVRVDLSWAQTERTPGTYDFAAYDKLISDIEAQGLSALVILGYGNPHYADTGDTSPFASRATTPEFRQAYAKWAAAAVKRYAGKGFLWELWNEPNHPKFWPPQPSPDAYVALVRPACQEIRKVAPNECIIGPACSQVDLPFIEVCLQLGMLNYWSAVSVHPYRQTRPESAAADYAALRSLLLKYAPEGRIVPIICGEVGYSTAWSGFSDQKQADYLTQLFRFNRRTGIALTIWYDWRDNGDDPANKEHRFGLVRRSATGEFDPKPAYFAARRQLRRTAPSP